MATEITVTTGPGQTGTGEYSSLSAFESGMQCDLTAAATKVFAHGGITGTVADNDSVTGQTSSATGTVVHCTTTQILIESISGTFQSGEIVRVSAGNEVTISDAGDSAIAVAECETTGNADGQTLFLGSTTNSTNRYIVRAASGHEAECPYNTNLYRIEVANTYAFYAAVDVDVDNIQLKATGSSSSRMFYAPSGTYNLTVTRCTVAGDTNTVEGFYLRGGTIKIKNCFIYDVGTGIYMQLSGNVTAYNNTFHNMGTYGARISSIGQEAFKNNLISATDAFHGTWTDNDTYNNANFISQNEDNVACGTDGAYNQTFSFVDEAGDNFHVASDDPGLGDGVGSGSDSEVPLDDFDGDTRDTSTPDIGADEYVGGGSPYTNTHTDTKTITDAVLTKHTSFQTEEDTKSFSDAIHAYLDRLDSIADTETITDVVSITVPAGQTFERSVEDTLSASDAVSIKAVFPMTQADTGVFTDFCRTTGGAILISHTDSFSLSDLVNPPEGGGVGGGLVGVYKKKKRGGKLLYGKNIIVTGWRPG